MSTNQEGPWQLARIDLRTGDVTYGPTFPFDEMVLADGYLWLFGAATFLCQVSTGTLTTLRQLSLPLSVPDSSVCSCGLNLASGPDHALWITNGESLVRVDVGTWRVIARSGLSLSPGEGVLADLASDPSGSRLFISVGYYQPLSDKGVVEELDGYSGDIMASTNATSPAAEGYIGAWLLAAPSTVWVSFRTGMAGGTVALHTSDLSALPIPANGVADPASLSPDNVYSWFQSTDLLYEDGVVWVSNESSTWACVSATTGAVLASEGVPATSITNGSPPSNAQLLWADPETHLLYGMTEYSGLVAVTAPGACWT